MLCVQILVVTVTAFAVKGEDPSEVFGVIYEWNKLDFTWPDDSFKARFLDSSQFIPENTTISGVKVWRDRLFVTLPRWRRGVPATLASIPLLTAGSHRNASPKLEPFPSWEMQHVGNCSALQNVQNVEIHPDGYMWVIDSGRVNTLSQQPDNRCPPKIVMFDLTSVTSSVRIVTFSDSVTSGDTNLVDIVLDNDGTGYTYISDASEKDPGLIVYSWKENRSWKVRDSRSMRADPGVRSLSINGVYVDVNKNIDGLALSPVSDKVERRLYYSPLSSYSLFSIPTSVLKDETRAVGDVSGDIKTHGRKTSISEGMAMDSRGVLYYGLLGENAIAKWDTNLPFEGNQRKIAQDNNLLQWPASFGFDSQLRNLTVVSNRLQNFLAGRVHLNEPNCRIITAFTGTKSYLY
ncbi:Protein yellow, partial [Zootermopsis nevadensis]